ncbi:hypothetical protein OIU74_026304 [Salix koriyanagi]|uniref:NB-ARC domain-containing protein n=1 Tax=Salix koriyanagi TaxID=2511006 RepID=A0A9Q1A3X7_9ROSI|nr:hypothetical protein OIU74_026304 [Salix koriyanagi]
MCNGLPLALITVGRAMALRKTLSEWHHSIEALSRATAEFPSTPHQDFVLVKFGYDSLPSDKVRSCFLYCALFPEGFCIKKSDLIDYWIGEGFLGAYSDACEARIEDSRRERPAYLVKAGTQLADAPEVGKWEVVRKVSLMANNIQNLSKAARCNDLYLNLSWTGIRQVPVQLKNLVKLKCLNLEHTYELRTIPMQVISNFSSLTVLRMAHCGSSDRAVGRRCPDWWTRILGKGFAVPGAFESVDDNHKKPLFSANICKLQQVSGRHPRIVPPTISACEVPRHITSRRKSFVDDCPNLRKLPLNSNSAKEHRIVIQGWEDWWRRLEWEDEAAQHTFLPSFKGCL